MKPNPLILLFATSYVGARLQDTATRLRSHGFDVLSCGDLLKLYSLARKSSRQTGATMFVMLSGSLAENCLAAKYLRALYPASRILALVSCLDDSVLVQSLESGADAFCPRNASTELLLATVFRLLGRSSRQAHAGDVHTVPVQSTTDANWALLDNGWILGGPQGLRIPLTTGERSFLMTLLAEPDLRASHCKLISAVNASYDRPSPVTHQARLGVMVSRLRRKFREYGLSMPLRSVHNWGYMFTGPVAP
ncbi:hypothetical protein EKL30_07250 [Candidimonas sp. SYP-B2681]|uniref:hypothetical protein n=1 Tax=Candidimonas sp. SYP-B2681 TaxID=2497686 RepID=UPI000F89287D|nr:hypothetical protein [Candidimonas sp. SYP-B2681]RTZ45796.1 hypothetical protein EKL30_07250 [Candidimonas sp. SYP-B2681]